MHTAAERHGFSPMARSLRVSRWTPAPCRQHSCMDFTTTKSPGVLRACLPNGELWTLVTHEASKARLTAERADR